jgi:hypothetical protein
MSKNPFNIKTGGSVLKKLVLALIALALIAIVLKSPVEAAESVHAAADKGSSVLDSLTEFVRAVFKG